MISISRLLCGHAGPGDHLRYERRESPRPIVVWNCTRACNLKCIHCYASADNHRQPGELTTEQGRRFIDDLVAFGVPVILFSGGEPLYRNDLLELAEYAKSKGLRVSLSTNGTLITKEIAKRLKEIGFAEVGISLDGIGGKNDRFRGRTGAFDAALRGIRSSQENGLRVSLRLTITRLNYEDIPQIFDLVEEEGIDRVCFYHLAYSGRGDSLKTEDINHDQTRAVVESICARTVDMDQRGLHKEILTVGNHTDGVYAYLRLKKADPAKAENALRLLQINGGNNTGVKIGAVDDRGNVHPDQFWWHYTAGNVMERKFGDIWTDPNEPMLEGLRNRRGLLKGRCARCQFLDVCNGNLRIRAEAVYGDVWQSDPACYLTDEEIGLT